MRPNHVTVIGAGSWGTALAVLLSKNISRVTLWGHDPEELRPIIKQRENQRFLPGIALPDNLDVKIDLEQAINDELCFVMVVPSHAFRAALMTLRNQLESTKKNINGMSLVWGTKGFDPKSGDLLSHVAQQIFPEVRRKGVISGPSFAMETAIAMPTALTLASESADAAESMSTWFRTEFTRVYFNNDPVGVQLGGAIKNVMAIAAGISDGLGYGANARAALITRGLSELTRLGITLGGKPDTFMGLTGVGDLILTCTDNQSRNRRFGLGLGQGKNHNEIKAQIGQEIEGINTVRELFAISQKHDVDMPITEQVYKIVYHDANPDEAVRNLLRRDPKPESD